LKNENFESIFLNIFISLSTGGENLNTELISTYLDLNITKLWLGIYFRSKSKFLNRQKKEDFDQNYFEEIKEILLSKTESLCRLK
jgi:hypothetical protein